MGMSSNAFNVAIVSNALEQLYKAPGNNKTDTQKQTTLNADRVVRDLANQTLANNPTGLSATQTAELNSLSKLYTKKVTADTALANSTINDVSGLRQNFGASIDSDILGAPLEKFTSFRNTFTQANDTEGVQLLDMYVHARTSHEGDLVRTDGTRLSSASPLPSVDPATGKALPVPTPTPNATPSISPSGGNTPSATQPQSQTPSPVSTPDKTDLSQRMSAFFNDLKTTNPQELGTKIKAFTTSETARITADISDRMNQAVATMGDNKTPTSTDKPGLDALSAKDSAQFTKDQTDTKSASTDVAFVKSEFVGAGSHTGKAEGLNTLILPTVANDTAKSTIVSDAAKSNQTIATNAAVLDKNFDKLDANKNGLINATEAVDFFSKRAAQDTAKATTNPPSQNQATGTVDSKITATTNTPKGSEVENKTSNIVNGKAVTPSTFDSDVKRITDSKAQNQPTGTVDSKITATTTVPKGSEVENTVKNTVNGKSAEVKPADSKPTDTKSTDPKPTDTKPTNSKPNSGEATGGEPG